MYTPVDLSPKNFINPINIKDPQNFIHPIFENFDNPITTPISDDSPKSFITPLEYYIPQLMHLMGNPDYQGHYGFPEKPTGLGGLRPVGSLFPGQPADDEKAQVDPGTVSLYGQFGNKGMAALGQSLNIPKNPINHDDALEIIKQHGLAPDSETLYDPSTRKMVPGNTFYDQFGNLP